MVILFLIALFGGLVVGAIFSEQLKTIWETVISVFKKGGN